MAQRFVGLISAFPLSYPLRLSLCLVTALSLTLPLLSTRPAQAEEASEQDMILAKQYYELGKTFYDQGAYDKALSAFEQSYGFSHKPALLYNIAKCHESLGQLEQAILHYRRFLDESGKTDPMIRARIRNLEARLAQQQGTHAEPVTAPPPPKGAEAVPKKSKSHKLAESHPAAIPEPTAAASVNTPAQPLPTSEATTAPPAPFAPTTPIQAIPQPKHWMRWAGWSLVGVGALSVAASFVFGARAASKSNLVEKAYRCGSDPGTNDEGCAQAYAQGGYNWSDIQSIADDGRRFEQAQLATLIVGGVLAGGGVLLLALAPPREGGTSAKALAKQQPTQPSLAPMVTSHSWGLAGLISF